VSEHFERWTALAALTLKEQDPTKLTELATEMNLVLSQNRASHEVASAASVFGPAMSNEQESAQP
jgi:hypothetical protein